MLGHQTLLVQITALENIAFYSGGNLVDVVVTTGSYRPTEPYPSPEPRGRVFWDYWHFSGGSLIVEYGVMAGLASSAA
jgi:hypothetical protein